MTSEVMERVLHNRYFVWNDVFPYVPRQNEDVDQYILRKLVDKGAVPALVAAFQQRMEDFVKSEKDKGRTPLNPINSVRHSRRRITEQCPNQTKRPQRSPSPPRAGAETVEELAKCLLYMEKEVAPLQAELARLKAKPGCE